MATVLTAGAAFIVISFGVNSKLLSMKDETKRKRYQKRWRIFFSAAAFTFVLTSVQMF